ncbi:MAG: response regulator [bacterium]|nr:response regulator [bacterium]
MKKILIVDDEQQNQETLTAGLMKNPDLVILQAYTRQEAVKLFDENPDVALIAMDACMPHPDASAFMRGRPNTQWLVAHMKKTFKGPIVAVSSAYNSYLMEAGCTHKAEKQDFPHLAAQFLGL